MRPSSILTFEPGLEHGVPWGRDLFTFVTSAAGHMMRTLQRPRKNKPSKRQVNHRRFLHNMIQRKFAEIEASNHQLASALFSAEKSHLSQISDQSPKTSKKAIETFINVDKTEALPDQEDVCDLWTLDSLMETHVADKSFPQCKSFNRRGTNLRAEKDSKALKNNPGDSMENDVDFEVQSASNDLASFEDSMSTWFGSIGRTRAHSQPKLPSTGIEVTDLSPPSPVISLLSLDSCDLEVQMLIDGEHSIQTQDGMSLQMDIMDDLDLLDCSDTDRDLQIHSKNPKFQWMTHDEDLQATSILPNSLETGYDLENLTATNNYMSNLGQVFDANSLCDEEPLGLGFHHNQMNWNNNHFGCAENCIKVNGNDDSSSISDLSIVDDIVFQTLENQLDSQQPLKSLYKNQYVMMQDDNIRDKNMAGNLSQIGLSAPCPVMCCPEGFSYHKEESCFYSKFRANQSSHNFEGVARSFPATSHKIHHTPILTPPLDDDWLFSDIVAEEEINSMSNMFGNY